MCWFVRKQGIPQNCRCPTMCDLTYNFVAIVEIYKGKPPSEVIGEDSNLWFHGLHNSYNSSRD